eukprot:TRINITY_DN8392_c0_g2_i1.p1 TRINITY_DN8392_c0_g2~~TRINITY_DN8392_c0_g2_i1.p1  ORF type:complete len:401 (-),score=57.39 TRINITY_DN8392_c0_g2_i1:303-1505(-)
MCIRDRVSTQSTGKSFWTCHAQPPQLERMRRLPALVLLLATLKCAAVPMEEDSIVPETDLSTSSKVFHPTNHTPSFRQLNISLFNQTGTVHLHTDGLLIQVCIQNAANVSQRLITRDTPFERETRDQESTLSGTNMFSVTAEGSQTVEEPYIGPDVKRGALSESSSRGFEMKPGQVNCTHVNLGALYKFPQDGKYVLRLRQPTDGHLSYTHLTSLTVSVVGVQKMQALLQQRHDEFWAAATETMVQSMTTTSASSYPLTYVGCSSSEQASLYNYHREGMTWIELSANHSWNSSSNTVNDWFGSVSESVYAAEITSGFSTMLTKAAAGTTYVCQSSSCTNGCICGSGNVFAYVYPTSATPIIYMCSFTFTYEPASERVQTVVHEYSHFDNVASNRLLWSPR